ncbi:hypothetical protein EYF80_060189 [Liparis tanakae]|uniref:Uncharacterized protein n=1 Tax=Liparis tanakae TaxID=230148 RepID=A0A4Z2EMQ7_9TELE|nr:hypothetical protein EYF80_060189 [Liparis tanakae]
MASFEAQTQTSVDTTALRRSGASRVLQNRRRWRRSPGSGVDGSSSSSSSSSSQLCSWTYTYEPPPETNLHLRRTSTFLQSVHVFTEERGTFAQQRIQKTEGRGRRKAIPEGASETFRLVRHRPF